MVSSQNWSTKVRGEEEFEKMLESSVSTFSYILDGVYL